MNRREKADLLKEMASAYFNRKRYAVFHEVVLRSWRTGLRVRECRADVVALNTRGDIVVVEVKSCTADYASDTKWEHYFSYANYVYFCIPPEMKVPQALLDHPKVGLLIPQQDGLLRVCKRPKRTPVPGKLRKALVLHLIFRAADRTRLTKRGVPKWMSRT